MNGRTDAFLVWDGTDEVRIPPALGEPRADQMQGTVRERLCELAARNCYDSLGKGRSSEDYWKHILEVGHFSVLEHGVFTVEMNEGLYGYAIEFLNKPCLLVRADDLHLRVTGNLRHVFEWEQAFVGYSLRSAGHQLAPAIIEKPGELRSPAFRVVEPKTDEEKWVTLFLVGSRGMSHEIVRHGDWTAISQRSTRYVDESESPWVMHPLITSYSAEKGDAWSSIDVTDPRFSMQHTYGSARITYDKLVDQLQSWLLSRGVDKVSARKQARGAARGFLGNALQTEVVFSASVAQWRHMMRMRCSAAADAEIREVFAKALACLKASRYGDRFADLVVGRSPDGIGECLVGGGAR